jgi:hypothetical protein
MIVSIDSLSRLISLGISLEKLALAIQSVSATQSQVEDLNRAIKETDSMASIRPAQVSFSESQPSTKPLKCIQKVKTDI